jgi:pimeloyl-ACP methyl ester carboxylesterase
MSEREHTREIIGPVSSYYISQRLKLHFADWGNEEKPPLLLVHGGRDHARSWDWVARALRDEYHVIAPDLRGHGDSAWSVGGQYTLPEFVLDISQLIDTLDLAPVRIVAHSMGAAVSLFYSGVFPSKVRKLVAIEGMKIPDAVRARMDVEIWESTANWIEMVRETSRRQPRRYATIEDAAGRMQTENPHLSADQARHLTVHGVARNEDGTFSWKFDHASRPLFPQRMPADSQERLWQRIECPTLLMHGTESWHGDPSSDGRSAHIGNGSVVAVEDAGHWVHHDQLDFFLETVRAFLRD